MPILRQRPSPRSPRALPLWFGTAAACAVISLGPPARAAELLQVVEVKVDVPTLHAIGVQVRISDDDDRDELWARRRSAQAMR